MVMDNKTYINYIEEFLEQMRTMNKNLENIGNELDKINGNGVVVTVDKE